MAMRGGPARRVPGNALGGLLRDIDRRSRTTTRRSGRGPAPEPERGERGPAGPPGPPGKAPRAAVVVTDDEGRARWEFPAPYTVLPVLTALPVDPDPAAGRPVFAVLEEVTAEYAVVRVWRARPRRGQGVADPAGAGVSVHVAAVSTPA